MQDISFRIEKTKQEIDRIQPILQKLHQTYYRNYDLADSDGYRGDTLIFFDLTPITGVRKLVTFPELEKVFRDYEDRESRLRVNYKILSDKESSLVTYSGLSDTPTEPQTQYAGNFQQIQAERQILKERHERNYKLYKSQDTLKEQFIQELKDIQNQIDAEEKKEYPSKMKLDDLQTSAVEVETSIDVLNAKTIELWHKLEADFKEIEELENQLLDRPKHTPRTAAIDSTAGAGTTRGEA
jgi:hypothetical protein